MNIVKKISWISIFYSFIEIVLGICLICNPNATLITFCYLIASFIVVAGLCSILNYFIYGFEPFGFMKGVAEIAIGICCLPLARVFASPQVFATVVGIVTLISGLFKIQTSFDARRAFAKGWWTYLIYGFVLVTLAIIMMCYPFGATNVLLIFLGAVLIADAIFDVIVAITVNTKLNKIKKQIKKEIEQ